MGLTRFEETIAAIHRTSDAIDELVDAIRALDSLQPSGVRTFNGAIDDLTVDFAKIEGARTRLLQRTQTAHQGDPGIIPVGAQAMNELDGQRP